MKLPEFTATRRMNTNMTSQINVADRGREFQANANVAGMVNKFSEDLERKRRASNIQTFKRDENIDTIEEWADVQEIVRMSKRTDGSFDFERAQGMDEAGAHDWERIKESLSVDEENNKTVGYDQVVGEWWKGRVQKGMSRANNSDQAEAYLNSIAGTQLDSTIKAQSAYNIEKSKYSETSILRFRDSVAKTLTAENALLDVTKFKRGYKTVESEIMTDNDLTSSQKEKMIQDSRNVFATKLLDGVNRVIVEEAQKGNKSGPKVKEAILYGMQFIKGINIGNKRAVAIVTKDGKEIIPQGRKKKGSEEIADAAKAGRKLTKTEQIVGAMANDTEVRGSDIAALAREGTISVDVRGDVSAVAEKYHALKDLSPQEIEDRANAETAAMLNAKGGEKINNIDTISLVGENIFSQALSPEQHSEWLLKLTRWSKEHNVKSTLTGLTTAYDLINVVAAGRDTPESNKALDNLMGRLTDKNNQNLTLEAKTKISGAAWNAVVSGEIMKNIHKMTPANFNDSMSNLPDIVEKKRLALIKKYPELEPLMEKGALQKDLVTMQDKLMKERAGVVRGVKSDAASYLMAKQDPEITAAHGSVEVALKNNDMNGAKIAINNFRESVRGRARALGIRNNVTTVPPVVSSMYAEKLAASSDIMQDPKGLATGNTLTELKSILGSGRDYMTGITEIINQGEKSGMLGDNTTQYKKALWVTSMTNDPNTVRSAIQMFRAKESGLLKNWDDALGEDSKTATESVRTYVAENYKEAMLGFEGSEDLSLQKKYYAFEEYLTLKVKNAAANTMREKGFADFFTNDYIASNAGSVDVENLGRKAARTMVGLSISDGKNAIMIPTSVIESYPQSPVQNRVEKFLDVMDNDKRAEFVNKYYTDDILKGVIDGNFVGKGKNSKAAQSMLTNLLIKEVGLMPDRIKEASTEEQFKFLAEKVRYKMADEIVFRGTDSGMVMMYKSNGDNGDLKFHTAIDPTTGDSLTVPWDTVIHQSSVDGFDPFKD